MASDVERLEAYAAHLLDGFIGLRESYAMLEPMLFDRAVIDEHGTGRNARGFQVLKNTLFLSCVQGISKHSVDRSPASPSIKKIVAALESPALVNSLRERYAIWHVDSPVGESDPFVLASLAEMNKSADAERRVQFDAHLAKLRAEWKALSDSVTLRAFKAIRDKISAHTDVELIDGEYKTLNMGRLGIKWGDLRSTIEAMQSIVVDIGFVVRAANYAWNDLDKQLEKAVAGFWSVPAKV